MEKLTPLLPKRKPKQTQQTSESRRFLPPSVSSKQWLVERNNTVEQIKATQEPFRSVRQPPVKPMYGVDGAHLLKPIQVEQPPKSKTYFSFGFTGQRALKEWKLRDSSVFNIDEQFMSDFEELTKTEAHQYQKIHNAERSIKSVQKGVTLDPSDNEERVNLAGSLGSVDECTPVSPQALPSLRTPTPEPPAAPPQPRINRNRSRNQKTHNEVGSIKSVQKGVTFYTSGDDERINSAGSLGSVDECTPESPQALPSLRTPTPEPPAALPQPRIKRSRMRNQKTHNTVKRIKSVKNGITFYTSDDEESVNSAGSLGSVDDFTPESPQALPSLRTPTPEPPATPPQPRIKRSRMRNLPGLTKGHNVAVNTRVNKTSLEQPREQQMEQLKEQPLSREQPERVLARAFQLLSADEWQAAEVA